MSDSPESNEPPTLPQAAAELRTVAVRARRLAREILDPTAETNLIALAEEMETRAAALESPTPGKSEPPQTE